MTHNKPKTAQDVSGGVGNTTEHLSQFADGLSQTLEDIGDAFISTDQHGRIRVMNRMAEQVTGWAAQEAIGRPLAEIVRVLDEATLEQLEAPFEGAWSERFACVVERAILVQRDGGERVIEASAALIRDSQGDPSGVVFVFGETRGRRAPESGDDRDLRFLTEIAKLRHGVSDASELMIALAERISGYLGADDAMFLSVDAEHGCFTLRHDFGGVLPTQSGVLELGTLGHKTVETQSAGRVTVTNNASLSFEMPGSGEGESTCIRSSAGVLVPLMRDGQWVASFCVSSRSARRWHAREVMLVQLAAERVWCGGEELRLLALVTAKTPSHESNLEGPDRFRNLVEGVMDYAIFLLDRDGKVATWNSGAKRLKGYDAAEIIGKHFSVFYTETDRGRRHPQEVLGRAASNGRYTEEGWRVRNDGSRFWADMLLTALYDPHGNLEGFAKVTRDSTERRRAESELHERQLELTDNLKEREALLQELHHRVKNNLQVISSLINLQMEGLPEAETRVALEQCKARIQAIALVHDKLYESPNYAHVALSDYVRSLAATVFHATGASAAAVALELELESGVLLSMDKATYCGLLLNELITNSLKHAFPGHRQGTLRIAILQLQDGAVGLVVADDGVGLAPDFELARASTLGLQLVSTLVEQLDGQIDVLCQNGTEFRVTFRGAHLPTRRAPKVP